MREAGTAIRNRIFDCVDERSLAPKEVMSLSELLMRPNKLGYSREPQEFLRAIEEDLAQAPEVFDIITNRMVPPLNLHLLRAAVCPE